MEVQWFVKIFNIKMGVLLALYLTFDGVQNADIMELHFLLWALEVIVGKAEALQQLGFQTVSMVVPSVDVCCGTKGLHTVAICRVMESCLV